jgi:sugar-specific transcriptional regulator TrmB
MQLENALATLGLNDKESAVYLALLQLGDASAYGIAKKSGLKNSTTYVILDALIKKEFAQELPRSRKCLYRAKSPEKMFEQAQLNLAEAFKVIPQLKSLTKATPEKVSVLYFEGVGGVKQVMDYRLREMAGKDYVGFYASSENIPKELVEYIDDWCGRLTKQGSSLRGIVPEHPSLNVFRKNDRTMSRTMKSVPYVLFSSNIEIDTAGDIVRIIDYKNVQGVVIENSEVARTVREIFALLWSKL